MVQIAQIGCGHWGKNLARNYAQIGALGAIVDPNPEIAARIGGEHGVVSRTLEEVLADPQIEGLSIATPAETHAEIALMAFDAGKHVYMEKPLALSIPDAEKMIKRAEETNRILMVGHLLQYHGIFRKMRELVEAGTIGKLRYIYSNRMSYGKFRTEENVWWSFAPHDISMILSLAQAEPTHMSAQGASYVTPGLADWCTAQMQFDDGLRAHLNISWLHPFKEQRLTVIGEAGSLVFEDSAAEWEKKLALYKHKIDFSSGNPAAVGAKAEYIDVASSEPLKTECQHFVDCVANGQDPRTDGKEGLAVLRCLQRGEECLEKSLKS